MDKIKKFLQDLPSLIKLRGNKKTAQSDSEQDEYDEMDEEDEKPGKVRLNDGEHGPVNKINKKIVTAGILVLGILAGYMFYTKYSVDDNKELTQRPPTRTEEAFNSNRSKTAKLDYEALINANKANSNKNPTANNPNQQVVKAQQINNGVSQPQSSANAYQETASVPAMRQNNFSAPYTLPANYYGMQQPVQAAARIESREDSNSNKEPTLEERFKSAISFAIGSSSKDAAASSPAVSPQNSSESAAQIEASGSPNITRAGYYGGAENILQAGTIIPAMLFSGINTDVEGQVTAQIQSDIYDSVGGNNIIIPVGSKFIGAYDAKSNGSGRVNVNFSIIVFPNGTSYSIENSLIAIDGAGYAGISGKVNRHTGRVLGAGMASSALAAIGSIAAGNTRTDTSTYTGGQLAMQGAMANLMNSASKMFENGSNVTSTITIEPGYEFNIYVTKPIAF